jgi:hypothetical protein
MLILGSSRPARAATFNVAAGDVAGLKTAINTANGNGQSNTINLASNANYDLTTIDNTSSGGNGLPVITSTLVIVGHAATVRRTGSPFFRIFAVGAGGHLALQNLTVSDGSLGTQPSLSNGDGAGINVLAASASLTHTDCVITNNTNAGLGGGVELAGNSATATITRSTISNNTALAGGGIQLEGSSETLILRTSNVTGNKVFDPAGSLVDGGGIDDSGGSDTVRIVQSTIDGNSAVGSGMGAAQGGGIADEGSDSYRIRRSTISNNTVSTENGDAGAGGFTDEGGSNVTIRNSTFSGNRTSSTMHELTGAGGIQSDADGTFQLSNVTIAGNTGLGGGLTNASSSSITIRNTLIAKNRNETLSPQDCATLGAGTITSAGYNLIQKTTGCTITGTTTGNKTGVNPNIGPLQDNGGPTLTRALLPGSPAIDAGNPSGCKDENGTPLSTDQRGRDRTIDGDGNGSAICDIGAFEFR